jgi:hypothetical protein
MLRLTLLLCTLLLAGCLPESKNPLSSPSASRIDRRLEGVYAPRGKDSDDGKEYWHFHYRGVRTESSQDAPRKTPWLEIMSVESRKDGGLKTQRYEALTTTIGGRDYMSFIEIPTGGAKTKSLPYKFARYEVNWRGDVRIWIAGDKAFAAAIKAGKLRGSVVKGKFADTIKITDTTERLSAFIAASDPKVLFGGDSMALRRIAP